MYQHDFSKSFFLYITMNYLSTHVLINKQKKNVLANVCNIVINHKILQQFITNTLPVPIKRLWQKELTFNDNFESSWGGFGPHRDLVWSFISTDTRGITYLDLGSSLQEYLRLLLSGCPDVLICKEVEDAFSERKLFTPYCIDSISLGIFDDG